jgi:glutamyl-tRNA synthetase
MPMILGSDRKRLSKRHGATSVEEFAALGILPDAMVNYLALLGWSPGGSGDEVLARDQLVKKFSLKKVGSSPAAFDYEKLHYINRQHIMRLPAERRAELVRPLVRARGWSVDAAWRTPGGADADAYLDRVLRTLGSRFQDLQAVPDQIAYFFTDDYPVDAEAAAEHLASAGARARLGALAEALAGAVDAAAVTPAARYEETVRGLAERLGVPAGELIHTARLALTGQTRSAGLFEVMELLGGPRVIARLRRAAAAG